MIKPVRVMIVGSICGGTGSGLGIQLPFLIREFLNETAHMPEAVIRVEANKALVSKEVSAVSDLLKTVSIE